MSKLCIECNVTKPLEGGYYKAGAYWQKRCKTCHNKLRTRYRKGHVPTPRYGFAKLQPDVQASIKADIRSGHKKKVIAARYDINYFALARWIRDGLI